MTSTLVSGVRAVRRRERQRPGLSWKTNAVVGAVIGAAVPVVLEIKSRYDEVESEPPRPNPSFASSIGLVSYCAALGAASSQSRWTGLVVSSIGTSVFLAPLGGFGKGGNWKQSAAAGAIAGPLVVRPFVRFVTRAI
jgi:hypothetical protein